MFFQAKQGSQNRVSSKCFQEEVSRKRFPSKVPSKFPKQDFQEHVFPSKTKFPGQLFKQVFPEEVSRKRCQSKVPSKLVPKQGFQEEVPKQGSQPQVPRNRCPYKVPKNRFTSKVPKHVPKQGSQQQVPRNRFPNKFPKNRFTSKVAGKSSQALFPGLSQPWGKILVFVPKCLHVKGNVCLSAQTPPIHWSVNFQGKEIRTKCASRLKASSTGNPWTCGLCAS